MFLLLVGDLDDDDLGMKRGTLIEALTVLMVGALVTIIIFF
jgi:hypothetical protein